MSERERLFRRRGGAGWIVVAESLPEIGGSLRGLGERLLERIDLSRRPICVASAASDPGVVEGFTEDFEAWLSVEIAVLRPEEMAALDWKEAGLVVLAGGPPSVWVAALANREGEDSIMAGAGEGSLVYAAGEPAEALGAWIMNPGGDPEPGTGWLAGSVILPGRADPAAVRGVAELLAAEDHSYAVGLGEGSVLALGPRGEVEVWGEARPTVTLGRGWR